MAQVLFTMQSMLDAFSRTLAETTSTSNIYINATQQNEQYPCWYIINMPQNELAPAIGLWYSSGPRYLHTMALDLAYMVPMNTTDMQQQYLNMVDTCLPMLNTLSYIGQDEAGVLQTIKLHCYNVSWKISDQVLHIYINLKVRGSVPYDDDSILMQHIEELNEYIRIKTEGS